MTPFLIKALELYNLSFHDPDDLKASILSHTFSFNNNRDGNLMCGLSNNDIFTTNRAYYLIYNQVHPNTPVNDNKKFNWIWKACCPTKIIMFLLVVALL